MRLYDRLQMFVWIDAFYADEAPLTRREHQAIIRAARGRDEKKLLKLAESHLRRSKQNVLRVLQARPSWRSRLGDLKRLAAAGQQAAEIRKIGRPAGKRAGNARPAPGSR